ncbi:MAG: hypothetical protein QW782_07895 [Candidatus Bathyarchaeia archaeon]
MGFRDCLLIFMLILVISPICLLKGIVATELTDANFIIADFKKINDGFLALGNLELSFGGQRYSTREIGIALFNRTMGIIKSKILFSDQPIYAHSLHPLSGGDIAIVGYSLSQDRDYEILLVIVDASGDLKSAKRIGGARLDMASKIIQDSAGNLLIVGHTSSFSTAGYDGFIMQVKPSGEINWAIAIGEPYYNDIIKDVIELDDGYMIFGYTWSFGAALTDILVIKVTYDGKIKWAKIIGGPRYDEIYRAKKLSEDSIILVGSTWSSGYGLSDGLLIKLSKDGELKWVRAIGGKEAEAFLGVEVVNDRIFAAGYTSSLGAGGNDILLACLTLEGEVYWARAIGTQGSDNALSVLTLDDSSLLLVGYSYENENLRRTLMVEVDLNGNVKRAEKLKTILRSDRIGEAEHIHSLSSCVGMSTNVAERMWTTILNFKTVDLEVKEAHLNLDCLNYVLHCVEDLSLSPEKAEVKTARARFTLTLLEALYIWVEDNLDLIILLLPVLTASAIALIWLLLKRHKHR